VNSAAYRDPGLLKGIADKFGAQALVVSIDARWNDIEGRYQLYSDCGRHREAPTLEEHVTGVVKHGAGEIFINSIDRDGTMIGYDLRLISAVKAVAGVPVIACGGAGTYEHMKQAFVETGVSALACGSLFNFGDNNPIRAKAFLSNYELHFKKV